MRETLLAKRHLTGGIEQLRFIGILWTASVEAALLAVGAVANGVVAVIGFECDHIATGGDAGVIEGIIGVGNNDVAHLIALGRVHQVVDHTEGGHAGQSPGGSPSGVPAPVVPGRPAVPAVVPGAVVGPTIVAVPASAVPIPVVGSFSVGVIAGVDSISPVVLPGVGAVAASVLPGVDRIVAIRLAGVTRALAVGLAASLVRLARAACALAVGLSGALVGLARALPGTAVCSRSS